MDKHVLPKVHLNVHKGIHNKMDYAFWQQIWFVKQEAGTELFVLILLRELVQQVQFQTELNVFLVKLLNVPADQIHKMECVLLNQTQFVTRELGMAKLAFLVVKEVVHQDINGTILLVLHYQDLFVNLDMLCKVQLVLEVKPQHAIRELLMDLSVYQLHKVVVPQAINGMDLHVQLQFKSIAQVDILLMVQLVFFKVKYIVLKEHGMEQAV